MSTKMVPAVVSIPETTDEETRPHCSGCRGELSDTALKCGNCQAHIHLRCSRLPEYQLVRFVLTQITYNCQDCVKLKDAKGDEMKFEEEFTKIKETIAKEISIIDQINADESKSQSQNEEATKEDGKEENVEAVLKSKKLCHYYTNRKCKFGPKGEGCKFQHPKLCRSYIKYGNRKGGCKKGNNCSFAHPNTCWQASGGFECDRKNCKFLHPSGWRQKENLDTEFEFDDSETRDKVPRAQNKSYARVVRETHQGSKTDRPGNYRDPISSAERNAGLRENERNFLDIKEQLDAQMQEMKTMQQQIVLLLQEKTSPRCKTGPDRWGNYQTRW